VAPSPTESAAVPSGISWSEHPFDGLLSVLAIDGDHFVGVGGTADGLAAWTSTDGVDWEREDLPHPGFLAEYLEAFNQSPADETSWLDAVGKSIYPAVVQTLVRLGDTLYAFGTFQGNNDFFRPVGWRLTDGGAWEFIESSSFFFDECCSLFKVAASDDALVGVKQNFGMYSAEIWRWTPATSWVEATPGLQPQTGTAAGVFADVVWSQGQFVAVGALAEADPSTASNQWPTTAASWVSANGLEWDASNPAAALEGAQIGTVVGIPNGGYFALGCTGCNDAPQQLAWNSADGLAWGAIGLPTLFSRVIAAGSALLAIEDADGNATAWTSADGVDWVSGAEFTGVVSALAADGERIGLALRTEGTASVPPATVVWIGTFP
jgi:hypothetical protein